METLQKLRSLELYLAAHPDCEINSECADRLSDVQELLKEFTDNPHKTQKLEADKAELLEMCETLMEHLKEEQEYESVLTSAAFHLIQKHKQ